MLIINLLERGITSLGGRGTYAVGRSVDYRWKTLKKIDGVKVLQGKEGAHKLPEEAHSSYAYIRLNPDGSFREIRFYGIDHFLKYEIAYHPEPNINNGNRKEPIVHDHVYDKNFNRTPAVRIHKNNTLYKKVKGYLQPGNS